MTVLADRGLQDVRPHEGDPRRSRLVVVPLGESVDRQDVTPARSLCRLLLLFARMLFVPVAFLDLLRSAFLGFCFQLLRVLTFAVTHFCSLLFAIDFRVQFFDADAFRTWHQIRQLS